jgi:CDP-diacylglycerol--glycerol-3-phosphate 3-phosphatidyltransferase
MKRNEFWTIPNMITSYRLLMFPVILYFIISDKEKLFAIFIVINIVTDWLDGKIAKWFKMETEIGAKLDSFADNFTYLLAFIGVFVFKMEDIRPRLVSFIIYIGMLVLPVIVSLVKFRKFPSFHLYMSKIGGYIQAFFFICWFTCCFCASLYYFMITWLILSAIESLAIQMIIPEMRSNVKGLYWVLKERKAEKDNQNDPSLRI